MNQIISRKKVFSISLKYFLIDICCTFCSEDLIAKYPHQQILGRWMLHMCSGFVTTRQAWHEAVSPGVSGADTGAICGLMYLCKKLLSDGRSSNKSCLFCLADMHVFDREPLTDELNLVRYMKLRL